MNVEAEEPGVGVSGADLRLLLSSSESPVPTRAPVVFAARARARPLSPDGQSAWREGGLGFSR
ncbi:MAG: hypothetical protein R6T96_13295 [Longimicrobiales bacterium]